MKPQRYEYPKRIERSGGVIHEFVNSPRNDENSWDKMPSCPTFSEESFMSQATP